MRGKPWLAFVVLGLATCAQASGPRFVTGSPYFPGSPGVPIGWKQTTLLYSTDPGALGASVNHAASDALVAAAAGAWNVPVASITIGQGMPLAEHVSGQNVYLSTSGLVWPDDVDSSNSAAVPIAVVYDTDGSVTDTLLGTGASGPDGCQQNAVTESVDKFDPAGYILHAIIVINGRCTGSAPEQQLQLQYQLERVFGRVLGLAWSQVNDNVFTGSPTPNRDQAEHWPIMHPIDILCGPYSYQCLPDPFTLRPDDLAGMVLLYPIPIGTTAPAGKQVSLQEASSFFGWVEFPNGEGMAGVRLAVQRSPLNAGYRQDWEETASLSGATFLQNGVSPFVPSDTSVQASFGWSGLYAQRDYVVPYMQIIDPHEEQGEVVSLSSINPLYIGSASLGPYSAGVVSPAGAPPVPDLKDFGPLSRVETDFLIADAPSPCGDGSDGAPTLPAALPSTGWWNGVLCAYGHASYYAETVKEGRTIAVEVTALDANGFATTSKAMPVIGLFAPTDAAGALPSLAVAPTAFQGKGVGTTVLTAAPFAAGSGGGTLRVGIADQRGDGRPDFLYQARFFYADNLMPAQLAESGGTVTISGTGFRVGNAVTINGFNASVTSWSPTTIVLTAPAMSAIGATPGTAVDVSVSDLGTGATSVMTAALTYAPSPPPNEIKLISAPTALMFVGDTATVPFTVEVVGSDGSTPVAGQQVAFSSTANEASFSACGSALCNVVTDGNGMAATNVIPAASGTVTIQAAAGSGAVSASFQAVTKPNRMIVQSTPNSLGTVGLAVPGAFQVQVVKPNGNGISGELVTLSVTQGSAIFSPCNASPCGMTTNYYGQAATVVTLTSAGPVTIVASDGSLAQSITLTGVVDAPQLQVQSALNPTSYVGEHFGRLQVELVHSDGVTPIRDALLHLTADPGIVWDTCGGSSCTTTTDQSGQSSTNPIATATGTYHMTVSYATASLSFTVVVSARVTTLTVQSAPSGVVPAGTQASVPFAVQLVNGFGNPVGGQPITIGGEQGRVLMGCGGATCTVYTDGNGWASSTVTPLLPGELVLNATWSGLVAATTLMVSGQPIGFLLLQSPPTTVHVGDLLTFEYQAVGTDGVTPLRSQTIYLFQPVGSLPLPGCSFGTCLASTDQWGRSWIKVVPAQAGPVTFVALCDGQQITVNLEVLPLAAWMNVVSQPSGTVAKGTQLASPFTVQVVEADGKTPVSGQNVAFSVASGSASLGACPSSTCVVQTNGQGLASTTVTAGSVVGAVTLTAVNNLFSVGAGFNVVAADVLSISSAPASVLQGATAATPFAAKLVAGDGGMPVAGMSVVLSAAGSGSAIFTACGQTKCTLVTDATGSVSSTVSGLAVGAVTLTATASAAPGSPTASSPFQVISNVRLVVVAEPTIYAAAGAKVGYTEDVTAYQNGSPAAGLTLAWSGGSGMATARTSSTTDANGRSSVAVTAGPLLAGVTASGAACGWSTACGHFSAVGVAGSDQWLTVLSGGQQSVTGGAALEPLVLQVMDGAGHAVAGAVVTVGQTVYANDGACPAQGRCPAAPLLASGQATVTSAINGQVAVQPMVQSGVPTKTAIALSVGSQGFATAEVWSSP